MSVNPVVGDPPIAPQSLEAGAAAPSRATEDGRLDARGVAATILCCALWGGNAVAVKYSVPALPAFGAAAIRFAIGLPVIALACLNWGQPLRLPRKLWGLAAFHALLTVVQIGTFNWGTSHSLAGRASVFINIHPLVVAPLAWIWLGERLGVRAWAGLGAAAFGVAVLLYGSFGKGDLLVGDLVVLGSGVIFGLQTIAQKLTFPRIPPATLLFNQSALAIPAFLAYSGVFEGFDTYRFTRESVGGVIFQGLFVSGICFTVWMFLLRRYAAGRLAALAFLTPLFGIGFGNLTRAEPLGWRLLIGGALVGCGIYLVATDRRVHGQEPDISLPGEDAP